MPPEIRSPQPPLRSHITTFHLNVTIETPETEERKKFKDVNSVIYVHVRDMQDRPNMFWTLNTATSLF